MEDDQRKLALVFIDGNANGIIIATEPDTSVYVLKTPRTLVPKTNYSEKYPKVCEPGVYLLNGEKEGKRYAYIGQAGNVAERVKTHLKKDWWTDAILFTMKITVAHAKYFESRLISEARRVNKVTLDNVADSILPANIESDRPWLDRHFAKIISMILPVLGVDYFVDESRVEKPVQQERPPLEAGAAHPEGPMDSPIFELGAATARQVGDKFVVYNGSTAAKEWKQNGKSYESLFNELKDSHVLEELGDHRVFSRDYAFDSASAAASVVNGFPSSGPQYWRVRGQNKTLRQWESEQVDAVEGIAPASN
jgi:uncharacterized protein DUF4357